LAISPPDTGEHQVRLYLSRSTVAQLLDYQSRFVGLGRHKPSYSALIGAAVACSRRLPFDDLLAEVEGRP
jgi:hypothetical protein